MTLRDGPPADERPAATAGVVAAQGIPGFSFTAPTTVTSGTLRPPTTTLTDTAWDIDGSGTADFNLHHGLNVTPSSSQYAGLRPLNPFAANFNGLIATGTTVGAKRRNVADGAAVGPSAVWNTVSQAMTTNLVNQQPAFPTNTPGTIGFRLAFGNSANQYYYGWASLTIDAQSPARQGFKITEAFSQSTPNTAINVGAVPVPEPASMGVLALGATGIVA